LGYTPFIRLLSKVVKSSYQWSSLRRIVRMSPGRITAFPLGMTILSLRAIMVSVEEMTADTRRDPARDQPLRR